MKNIIFNSNYLASIFAVTIALLTSCDNKKDVGDRNSPSNNLKVVIIRHGEKPKDGDNLSCQGQSRAV